MHVLSGDIMQRLAIHPRLGFLYPVDKVLPLQEPQQLIRLSIFNLYIQTLIPGHPTPWKKQWDMQASPGKGDHILTILPGIGPLSK